MLKKHWAALSMIALALTTISCNMTEGVDSPDNDPELIARAQAALDESDCNTAMNTIVQVGSPNDRSKKVKGWAYLCMAGATLNNIGKSLFSYNSSTGDLTIFKTLAESIIPQSADKINRIADAVDVFNTMTVGSDRAANLAVSYFVLAASRLAISAGTDGALQTSDITVGGCSGSPDCITGAAGCTAGTAGTMTDDDARLFVSAILGAATVAADPTLGAIKSLSERMNQYLGSGPTALTARCLIKTQITK